MATYRQEYTVLAEAIVTNAIAETDFLITNKDGKTTFQFRTPSEGGVVIDSVASLVEEL